MSAPERSTLRLLARLEAAQATGQAVVLDGNTADVFVAPDASPRRLEYLLAGGAAAAGRGCVIISPVAGARQLTPPGCSPVPLQLPAAGMPPAQAAEAVMGALATSARPVLVILDWAELYDQPDAARLVELAGACTGEPGFAAGGHRLVIIGRTDGPDERLTRLPGVCRVEVPLPDHTERLCMLERLCRADAERPLRVADGLGVDRLATLTGGLRLDDLLRARDASTVDRPLDLAWVQTKKTAALARVSDGLRVSPPGAGMTDVAGLPQMRRLIDECRATGRAPQRILLAGPPGVGKTLVVCAIADELGLPAVALGQFRSRWVGDSERNLERVLATVEALSPCVLHIDEFDQAIGQRNTGASADGGTSERIYQQLLTFLGDNQRAERVTVIGTSNRPDALDPAMFDRFTIIPVLHPTPEEAVAILEVAARRAGRQIDAAAARALIEAHGGLLTGRVLVAVLERAMVFADPSAPTIGAEPLGQAFADLLMALDPVEHELLALTAIRLCSFRSHLPWVAARDRGEQPHIPAYLDPLLDEHGELQIDRLGARLAELKGAPHAP